MVIILLFFFIHWFSSLFFHTFFLHRYASHQMYFTSPFWEKTFYFLTWFFQGSSYLVPRAYAVMHRMHHAYSDTEKDPHSPHFFKDVWQMMMHTRNIYNAFVKNQIAPLEQFTKEYLPVWNWSRFIEINLILNSIFVRRRFELHYDFFSDSVQQIGIVWNLFISRKSLKKCLQVFKIELVNIFRSYFCESLFNFIKEFTFNKS
jgi:fatty-acid desaturase